MKYNLILAAILLCTVLNGQRAAITKNTDALVQLKEKLSAERKEKETRVQKYLKDNKNLERSFKSAGSELSLIDVREGHPLYYITHNDESVRSLGVYELRAGGRFGIDVGGENTRIGVWDRGLPLASHSEFQGRLLNSDAASEFSFHSTHVTGTILAGGVNPSAKGFCYRGSGRAFDWFQDTEEMIDEVLMNDMLVSNHSYGVPGGWNGANWLGDLGISDREDYRFGFYDAEANAFDNIAYNAPFYSIVTSAGNERGDSGDGSIPPDGPYDCITGFSTAKNVFTVGAVNKLNGPYTGPEDVIMSSFSSWGPLDDGRIKPDFVAPGVSLLSASNESDESYGFSSGTSMASPSVAGAVALINEAYFLFNSAFLRSATLKALLIHTAHEAGDAPGPDYEFGWGLVSADKAVDFIQNIDGTNKQLYESSLSNGSVFEVNLNPVQGEKITATLVWTDPAGQVPERSLDPEDLILVNDLDMLIEDNSGNTALPWILNPSSPMDAATKGDNFRDNVEKIEFESPDARPYTLRISHKGSLLSGRQDFSLLIEYTSQDEGIVNLYWVNGEGAWSDGDKWSDSSGGSSTSLLPDLNSKLIIDDNSFPAQGGTITMDTDYQVASLVAFSDKDITLDLGGHTLTVSGTTLMAADNFSIVNGTLVFENSDASSSSVIDLNGTDLTDLNIIIPESNMGTWSMNENELMLSSFAFESGALELANCDLSVTSLDLDASGTAELLLEGTDIQIQEGVISNIAITDLGNNLINIQNTDSGMLNINGLDFTIPVELNSAAALLDANGILESISLFNSDLTVATRHIVSNLEISGASGLVLDDEEGLLINNLQINSTESDRVSLSAGDNISSSSIEMPERVKLCFDYLDITDVQLRGNAAVSTGDNSTVQNSEGWFVGSCENLLFADFNAQYLCSEALSQFTDNSDGNVDTRQWFVNDELVFGEEIMEYFFEVAGTYDIRLEIRDEIGNSDSWQKSVQVSNSSLPDNRIIQNPTQLASLQLADAYQWYNYGLKLDGETQRVYIYNGEPGIYWVLTYEGDCNKRSEVLDLSSSVIDLDKDGKDIIKVYPNPVEDRLNLSWTDKLGNLNIQIYNKLSQLVGSYETSQGVQNTYIDTETLEAGEYLLIINNQKNTYVKRFIKL